MVFLAIPRVFRIKVCKSSIEDNIRNNGYEFLPCLLIQGDVPGPDQVGDEAGEAVPGRTDGHVGEVQLRDGEGLDSGGDWAGGPGREGLLDQETGSDESSDDDTEPEESDETSGGGDIDQAVNCGGFQKLLDFLQYLHFDNV